MVDVTAGQGAGLPTGLNLDKIKTAILRGDIALALGILTILVVLILPLPSIMLDMFLAISITLSILILMTALFIQAPLEFSSFPTILLISTMLRLSLNLASTRLILSRGHEGTDAAGHVIEAFGNFRSIAQYMIERHWAALQPVGKRFALEQFHDEIAHAALLTYIMQLANIGMIQGRDRACLALEALSGLRLNREMRRQNLHRYAAVETRVASSINLAHAAGTDRCGDFIRPQFCSGG